MTGGGAIPKGEFGRIRDFFAPLTGGAADSFGLMDDAALLRAPPGTEIAVTADAIVQGVHYPPDAPPEEVAARLLGVNLSDLAAKGAVPLCYMLTMQLPPDRDDAWVGRFAAALADRQAQSGWRLLGGDSVRTPGPDAFSVTAFGHVPAGTLLRRGGARPGDLLYASGTIGDAALGLMLAEGRPGPDGDIAADAADAAFLAERFRLPLPRLALGQALRGLASACMDVSDGLAGDLAKLAAASGCGAELTAPLVPLSGAARRALARQPALLEMLLCGGDDYELLFTLPPARQKALAAAARRAGTPVTRIGVMTAAPAGEVRVTDAAGRPLTLARPGYRHG